MQPTQVNFGRGAVIAEGHVLGGPTELKLQIARMPLSLADIVVADLGLGGALSGVVEYRNDHTGAPSGPSGERSSESRCSSVCSSPQPCSSSTLR